jgi:DNA polymerase III epsilon subunit-like protein
MTDTLKNPINNLVDSSEIAASNIIQEVDVVTTVQPPIPPPSYTRILVFDTETTGLIPKRKDNFDTKDSDNPYITQLSFVVFDIQQRCILQSFNSYVKIPEGVEISEEVEKITGITVDKCATEGRDICDVLIAFYNAYESVDCIVAHNIAFDAEMIHIEAIRNAHKVVNVCPYIARMFRICDKPKECTQKMTTAFCKLICKGKWGKYVKSPKLVELYEKIFGTIPGNLHNSLMDTLVCMRCYLKYRFSIDMEDFDELVKILLD